MAKVRAAIIFGGMSSEHEVSLMSSTSVLQNINREKYDVMMIGITKDGRWLEYTGPVELIRSGEWEQPQYTTPAFIAPDRSIHGLVVLGEGKATFQSIDVAFPVMHGRYAEDGTIQGLLELAGIPCVGPGVLSSAVVMDKQFTHMILDSVGIPTAKWLCLRREEPLDLSALEKEIASRLSGYPVFIKPANAGSSVGVSKAENAQQLKEAIQLAFSHDSKLIIEEAIVGQEIECAVIGNEEPSTAGVLGEIVPKVTFYDYDAKYFDDATDLYIPARIPQETAQLISDTAVRAYQALECRGLTRVDFFAKKDGSIVLNEANTLPGFTHISMYPKLFITSGVSYPQLIDRLLTLAIQSASHK